MTARRASEADAGREAAAEPTAKTPAIRRRPQSDSAATRPASAPRTRQEAEEQYVAARDAWIAAMKRANSGRAAHLATLAITQETYEAAFAEVELWRSGVRIPIPVEPERTTGIEVVVGQEFTWRQLHTHEEKKPGFLGRLRRRLSRR
jgi:hypothetical protein